MIRTVLKTALAASALILTACGQGAETRATEDSPRVVFETEQGDITIAVNTEDAPISAANFLAYVDAGHYDGASLYRVVRPDNDARTPPMEVVQGGMMGAEFGRISWEELDALTSPFDPIAHEGADKTGLLNTYGTISMARNEPGTASSEFFFNLKDNPVLDTGNTTRNPDGHGYAAFGEVVAGMDVLEAIQEGATDEPKPMEEMSDQVLNTPVLITRAYKE